MSTVGIHRWLNRIQIPLDDLRRNTRIIFGRGESLRLALLVISFFIGSNAIITNLGAILCDPNDHLCIRSCQWSGVVLGIVTVLIIPLQLGLFAPTEPAGVIA